MSTYHVDTKDGSLALAYNRILILGRHNGESLLLANFGLDEPAPTTALDAQQSSVEGLLELVFIAPSGLDLLDELGCSGALGLVRTGWSKVLPEEGMVDVAASVELDALLDRNLTCDVEGRDSFCLGLE